MKMNAQESEPILCFGMKIKKEQWKNCSFLRKAQRYSLSCQVESGWDDAVPCVFKETKGLSLAGIKTLTEETVFASKRDSSGLNIIDLSGKKRYNNTR